MNNSPTEGVDQSPASNEPTGQTTEQLQSAEQSNQDANSREQSQGSVQIGRASCRERVQISVVAVSLKKKREEKGASDHSSIRQIV